MDNDKRHFLLKSIMDQAQNPKTMGPQGRNCGCLGGLEGRISVPRACRVTCSPKGPKLGFEYLLTYKTLHSVRTVCTAFPLTTRGISRHLRWASRKDCGKIAENCEKLRNCRKL